MDEVIHLVDLRRNDLEAARFTQPAIQTPSVDTFTCLHPLRSYIHAHYRH